MIGGGKSRRRSWSASSATGRRRRGWSSCSARTARNPDPGRVGPIEERLTGDGAMGRDDERVRRMAAITLARLRAKDSLTALRDAAGDRPTLDPVAHAGRWAVTELTGERLPPP